MTTLRGILMEFKLKKGQIIALISGIFWALGLIANSYVSTKFSTSPVTIAVFNDIFGFLILAVYFILKYKKIPLHIFKNIKNYAVVIGAILAGPIGMICNNYAVKNVGSSIAAAITATYPVVAVILSVIILKQVVKLRVYIAILIIVSSIVIQNIGSTGDEITFIGIIFALICAFAWGSESVLSSYAMLNNITEVETLLLRQFASIVAYSLIIVPFSTDNIKNDLSFNIIPFLFLIAALNLISYLAYYMALNLIKVASATGLNASYVLFTPLFATIFLNEKIGLNIIIMGVCILVGIVLIVGSDSE